jgi:hypothetical protein
MVNVKWKTAPGLLPLYDCQLHGRLFGGGDSTSQRGSRDGKPRCRRFGLRRAVAVAFGSISLSRRGVRPPLAEAVTGHRIQKLLMNRK